MLPTDPGFAAAKINLALHVIGRRTDGYHLLDSVVVFANVGDRVSARIAPSLSLNVTGPCADQLSNSDENLVVRAARFLEVQGAAIQLEKVLPVASGIGGGSADAAAALRLLAGLRGVPLPEAADTAVLGADVPVCLASRPCRMQGIGDQLSILPKLPPSWLVLVNPGQGVATSEVFRRLARHDGTPLPNLPARFSDVGALAGYLAGCRNDLEGAAREILPAIKKATDAVFASEGCLLARMSGSGATCFGLFGQPDLARQSAERISRDRPDWWVRAAEMLA